MRWRLSGNAAHDLDYIVLSKSNIGETLSWSAFLDAGPRPRSFVLADGRLRPIG